MELLGSVRTGGDRNLHLSSAPAVFVITPPAHVGWRQEIHPGQVASASQGTDTHSFTITVRPRGNIVSNQPKHTFLGGVWEKTRELGRKPNTSGEHANPTKKAPQSNQNLKPQHFWDVSLTTQSPCHPNYLKTT